MGAGAFWVAYEGGSYGLTTRHTIAILLVWGLALALAARLLPLARVPSGVLVTGGLLGAFAVFTGLSALWAASAEAAFNEFDRVVLYLSVFLLAALASTHRNVRGWVLGLTGAVAAISLLALGSRFFPSVLPQGDLLAVLPRATHRLTYPLNYWNGLATFASLGFPLLAGWATLAVRPWAQGLAAGGLPALAVVIALAASRGGALTALLGSAVLVALTVHRWRAIGALAVGIAGSLFAVAGVLSLPALINEPFGGPGHVAEGRTAALYVLAACVGTGLLYALGRRFVPSPPPFGRRLRRSLAAAAILVAVLLLVAARPVQRLEDFKALPSRAEVTTSDPTVRFATLGGHFRWQLWSAAVEEWQTRPLEGRGAGSFATWWSQHRQAGIVARDAHSLYLETLGELGVVGLLLLLGAIGSGLVAAARRIRAAAARDRVLAAALAGVVVGFLFEASLDWVWELPAIPVLAFAALGLLVGPAFLPRAERSGSGRATGLRWPLGVAAVATGLVLVAAQAVPLLAQLKIRASQEAAARGDHREARAHALAARDVQPWAASPYLQLALVDEESGALPEAYAEIQEAIERNPPDWHLWYVKWRIERARGDTAQAAETFARVRMLLGAPPPA